jgi:nanoRNase/pAp phosphatase (c-di-AMP/oligoRNAs hydrolase)
MTLGGGGHPGAGGCHMTGDLVSTKEKVVRALDSAFNKRPTTNPPPGNAT